MTPEVSIIIPIYNAEFFLEHCLQSISNQRFKNFEVLLVDNNSTDDSLSICKHFTVKDKRFKLLHCSIQGAAAARNTGLKKASGQFIAFLDSDDIYSPYFLSSMIKVAKSQKADIVLCSFCYETSDLFDSPATKFYLLEPFKFLEIVFSLWSNEYKNSIPYGGHIGNKIFSSKIIRENYFPEDILGAEDELFIFGLRSNISKVAFLPYELYFYRQGHQSLRSQRNFALYTAKNRYEVLNQNLNKNEQRLIRSAFIRSCLYLGRQVATSNKAISVDELNQIRSIINEAIYLFRNEECLSKEKFGKYFRLDYLLLLLIQKTPTHLLLSILRITRYFSLKILMVHQNRT